MSESTYENINKNSFVKESIHILNQAYKDNRLVLFIGAGVDHFSDLPLWQDAIKEFCRHLDIKSENADNLRIPQYYYNARGKKEYVELSREIFCYNKELLINDVHKKIVDLNVNKVITTNYTDFLEREMDNRGYIYRVISQDKDLAYAKDEKLIIKMHGDFAHDNFVLKEEDYLKYSNNFRLIETYIKAIIAKNLILFIGYSFNDPDIKQIFSWVKDVLGNDFQHAYMLEGYREYDKNEFEYYRNLGVNTIYIKHFNENPKQALIDVLHIIKLGNMWGLSDVDAVRNNLIPYLNLNYVLERYLNKELSQCNLEIRMGILASTVCGGNRGKDANKLLSELVERLVKNTNILSSDDPYIEIVNALKKSDIRKIEVINEEGKGGRIRIPDSKREIWFEQMLNFDYKCLRENAEENDIINNGNEQFYLRQAYIYYILEDYAKSYKALCIAAEKAFYRRQYYVYYIAQFNKYRIKDYMSHDTRVSIRLRDTVKKDVEGIDLDKIILEMPTLTLGNKQILQDIGSFQLHYSLFQDEYRIAERVKKQENNFTIFQNKNPEYMTLQWLIKDYYNYIKYNYLMVDKYIESKEVMVLYIKSFLESVFTPDKTSDIMGGTYNIHASKIGKFEIFLMIKYMSEKELMNMLAQYDIESIPVENECYSYMSTVLNNLRTERKESREIEFWNCMILISYINPNYELLESAIDSISDKFCDYNYRFHKRVIYKLLEVYQKNNFENKKESKCLFENSALERFLVNLFEQAESEEDVSTLRNYNEIIPDILYVYYNTYGEYSKDINKLICNKKNLLIAKMYPYCDKSNRQLIKQHFEKWEKEISLASCEIYFHIVNNGIIKEKEDYEQQILYYITEKKGQAINGIDFPNDCQDLLVCMYNLYVNGKLIQVENFKKVVKEFGNDQLNFLSDMDHFDYNRFRLEWLLSCSDALLKQIGRNKNARRNISKKIAEKVENGSISDKYMKLYFKYLSEK